VAAPISRGASHAINPTLYTKLPFDHINDFAPVSMTGLFPNLLVVNNNLPVRNIPELIALLCCTCPTRAAARRWAPAIRASGARAE
jgi:tripartite-type tricarboxylate transporter receptor subunit TctC